MSEPHINGTSSPIYCIPMVRHTYVRRVRYSNSKCYGKQLDTLTQSICMLLKLSRRLSHVVTSVRYRHTSLSIVTHAGLSVWQTVIRLHAYRDANGACSYTVLSYAVINYSYSIVQ